MFARYAKAALAAALFLGAARPNAGQQPPAFRSTVDVVRVEVSVLDKDRRPVRGLTADDFSVRESGQERPIVAFAPVDLPQAPPPETAAAAWLRDAPRDVAGNAGSDAGRLVVIAFDWSIRFYDQQLARRIALAAVDALGPTDQATVLFTKPNAASGTPQGFTGDRARLRAAVNKPFAVALTDPHPDRSMQIIDPEGYGSGECPCGLCTLEMLTRLGRMLRTVSQRPKVVLFVGTYVRTFEAMRPTTRPSVPGQITPSVATMPGMTDCPGRLRDARREFERAMGEANVTVHVLDPVGVDSEMSTPLGPGRLRERLDSLPVMADMTGGRTVMNTSAPEAQVASILAESSTYYVLGFTPVASKNQTASRRIDVRARREGLTVKARNIYTPSEQPAAGGPPQTVLTRAVSDVLPVRDVPLEVSVVPMLAGARTAALLVGRLGAGAGLPTAMFVAALTPRAVPVTSRRIAIPSPPSARGGPSPSGVVSALLLEPGTYEVRVAVELEAGQAGSVHTFVDVPDFHRAPLSMSGVLLHVAPEEPVVLNELGDAMPFAPSARRTFASGETVAALVQVSQGTGRNEPVQPVAVRLRITDAHGAVVRNHNGTLAPAEFASHRTATARLSLPIRDLVPGQYLLTVDTTRADHTAERSVRFEMK